MSPIGRKASVEKEISPSHLAHSPLPPTPRSSPTRPDFSAPTAVFAKTSRSPRYSLASSASAYGGSLFLLDDAASPDSFGQPFCLMSPIGRKVRSLGLPHVQHLANSLLVPTARRLSFERHPPLLTCSPRSSLVPWLPLSVARCGARIPRPYRLPLLSHEVRLLLERTLLVR